MRLNDKSQAVDLTVKRLSEPEELAGTIMVMIAPVSEVDLKRANHQQHATDDSRIMELESENRRRREEMHTVREEMQTSQEELKSTNEELQSTNEELQSTNEELTTSKEELQSLNEELQTVNAELQAKVDQLSRANNDMKNLLNSTDIATLFLDTDFNIRRFTTPMTKIIKLIASDAGRPITDISSDLKYPGLMEDARCVLEKLVSVEREVKTRDGRRFSMRVMPYRTVENVIDGIVMTFVSNTGVSNEKSGLVANFKLVESLPALVWSCRPDGSEQHLSKGRTDSNDGEEFENWLDAVHESDSDAVGKAWNEAMQKRATFQVEARLRESGARYGWFSCRADPVLDIRGELVAWFGSAVNVEHLMRRKQDADRV